jgi:bacillithiol system protein YtxJ
MGIFSSIFGKSEEGEVSKINWIDLNNESQLDDIQKISKNKSIIIFKHSTRCSISRFVLKQFENEFNLQDKMDCYFLDLLKNREISNEISKRFKIIHQSPQLIVIKDGLAIYNASHEDIDAAELEKMV